MPEREPIFYVNGEFVAQSQARISVLDHALLYGDGVFDTVFGWGGRIFRLDEHIERSFRSMAAIALESPIPREEMRAVVIEAARRNAHPQAYIKWLITRGENGRPLMDPASCHPNFIVIVQPYIERVSAQRASTGVSLKTVAVRRPSGQVLSPQIKSLNYLNLVLAKIEAKNAGADEALLLDLNGQLCEATGCNVLVLKDGVLRTPRRDILRGITRDAVMELASDLGFNPVEADLDLYDAYVADEVMICSTAGGLLPVTKVDGRPIGAGKPGPAFGALNEAYRKLIALPDQGAVFMDAFDPAA
jgi:branched-chain amino acid aminotransferase